MRRRAMHLLTITCVAGVLLAACGERSEVTVDDPAADEDAGDEAAAEPDDTDDDGSEDDGGEGGETSPSPDEDAMADPCADHQGREDEMFIEVVAPVDDQQVDDPFELVGCSNVFEANVQWRLEADGETLEEGFTTAECGTGCVGAFDEEVALGAAADHDEVVLEVFAPSQASGEEAEDAEEVAQTVSLRP
ncbi:MAG: Gmad2 immunoglobulin-like domain-containing protein [Nitriliruptoraceae bacterium]